MGTETKQRVLIVEDDPVVGALFQELLVQRELDVVAAQTAEIGLEIVRCQPLDLVITDKNLPGMSGLALTEQVKKERPELDIIIMTAYADMASALEAFEHGVYDYLVKPFDSIDDVIRKIMRALEKRQIMLENMRLVKHLTEANARIEEMNRNLEGQVRERTKKLQTANARLEQLTLADDVTGLYNQRFLFKRLEEEFLRDRRYKDGLAVIMIDLDFFKRVNDNQDHLFGSRVLRRVGSTLAHSVRSIDMPVRYGGDEFVIILPHTRLDAALVVAERVRKRIESTDVGDSAAADFGEGENDQLAGSDRYDDPFFVTASLGVASMRESNADSPNALLQAADRALYAAKGAGRNRIILVQRDELVPVWGVSGES